MASASGAAADEPLGRVLICGAAGWLGRAITDAFITADFPVRLPRGGTC